MVLHGVQLAAFLAHQAVHGQVFQFSVPDLLQFCENLPADLVNVVAQISKTKVVITCVTLAGVAIFYFVDREEVVATYECCVKGISEMLTYLVNCCAAQVRDVIDQAMLFAGSMLQKFQESQLAGCFRFCFNSYLTVQSASRDNQQSRSPSTLSSCIKKIRDNHGGHKVGDGRDNAESNGDTGRALASTSSDAEHSSASQERGGEATNNQITADEDVIEFCLEGMDMFVEMSTSSDAVHHRKEKARRPITSQTSQITAEGFVVVEVQIVNGISRNNSSSSTPSTTSDGS